MLPKQATNLMSWKWWLAPLAVILAIGSFAYYLHLRSDYALCEVELPHVLHGPDGDRIRMDTRFCSPLAGDPGTIVLRYQRRGETWDHIFFAYNPNSGGPDDPNPPWYPSVQWNGPGRVVVSISEISQIQRRLDDDDNVHFTYRIGKVEYP